MRDRALLRRIVYVIDATLFARDYERYGMRYFAKRGIAVSVIDATALSHPNLLAIETGAPPPCAGIVVIPVTDGNMLDAQQRLIEDADIVINLVGMTGAPAPVRIYRLIARSRTPYLVLATNAFPSPRGPGSGRDGVLARVGNRLQRLFGGSVNPWHSLLARMPKAVIGITAPAIVVHSGTRSRAVAAMFPTDATTEEVWAHSMDWEVYRALRDNITAAENIAVFIDQNVGFQRDLIAGNMDHPETAETYYPKLRATFDRIERELGLDVVIAINPRSPHSDDFCRGLFGPRKVIKGDTAATIARARLVLGHRSTAIGFAVMFAKPVLILTSAPFQEHWLEGPGISAMAAALGKVAQSIDTPADINLSGAFAVDAAQYRRYLEAYVKTAASPDGGFWDIVADAIERICLGAGVLTPERATAPAH